MAAAVQNGSAAADAELQAVPEMAAADVLKRLVCGHCMKCPMNSKAELRRCSGCRDQAFCARGADGEQTSARCHKDGWKAHKPVCKDTQKQQREEAARAAAATRAAQEAAAAVAAVAAAAAAAAAVAAAAERLALEAAAKKAKKEAKAKKERDRKTEQKKRRAMKEKQQQ